MIGQRYFDTAGNLVTLFQVTLAAVARYIFDREPMPDAVRIDRVSGDRTAGRRIVEFSARHNLTLEPINIDDWVVVGDWLPTPVRVLTPDGFDRNFRPTDAHPVCRLSLEERTRRLKAVYDVLFVPPDKQWSPDDFDSIAQIFKDLRRDEA